MYDIGVWKCQYWLWSPWSLTAWQWQCMEAIKCCPTHCGMCCHSCCSTVRHCGSVWCGGFLWCTHWPSDVLLGLNPANGLALSCWNIPPLFFTCGIMWCCRISSRYLMAKSALPTCTRQSRWIPVHTMTLQPNIGRFVAHNGSITFPSMYIHQHMKEENETHLRMKQSVTWHVSISPSAGTATDSPLSDMGWKC